jgi:DNA-binding transcriptional regulator YdaS (Cro superfamily)
MVEDMTPYEALMAAVEIAGSQSALARIANVSSTAVWKWVQSSKRVPPQFVILVEAGTGISRHVLRPDIYPAEMPEAPSRWSGVDHRAGVRSAGVDARSRRVSCNSATGMKGASL